MLVYRLWKVLHAFEHRTFLLFEVNRLKALGVRFPRSIYSDIWKRPSAIEDFIHILAFIHTERIEKVRLVDVGANVGEFIDDFLACFKGADVIAFEPDPRNLLILRKKYINSLSTKIYDCALSDVDGPAEFSLSSNTKYSSLERYDKLEDTYRKDSELEKITINCARFDNLDLNLNDALNILKIDVQGHEISSINGFGKELDKFSACLIEASFADEYVGRPPSFSEIACIMKEHNLFPIVFQRFGRAHNSYGYERDILFVRRELLRNAYWYEIR